MGTEPPISEEEVSPTVIDWPQSSGDPIMPVWSYGGKKRMYAAEALRMMAHDLVARIKELELPYHKAMKEANGDGLSPMAFIKLQTKQINRLEQENVKLRREIDNLHRDREMP